MARRTSKLFTPPKPSASATHTNRDGLPSWERPIKEQYIQVLLSNTLMNTFYADKHDLLQESRVLHEKMMSDPEFMAKAAIFARNRGYMRTQPILSLTYLAQVPVEKGRHFEVAFANVIRTPNDLSDFFNIYAAAHNGSQGGRRVKRAAATWLLRNLSEYWTVKYGAEKGDGDYSLRDLIILTHPVGNLAPEKNRLFKLLVEGVDKHPELVAELPQIHALEQLKNALTPEQKAFIIKTSGLPHEVTTPFAGKEKVVWEELVQHMPIFALLKNLATIERHGVMEKMRDNIVGLFSNQRAIQKAKILPFRFLEAEKHVRDARVKDALRDALELSFENIPDIPGKTAVLLDCSPSMKPSHMWQASLRGQLFHNDEKAFIEIASIFATIVMKKAKGNGTLVCYDSEVQEFPISMRDSVLTQAKQVAAWQSPAGGTHTGKAVKYLTDKKTSVDNLVVITDGEENGPTQFIDELMNYRRKVNPKVKTFVMDVSPYRNAIAPVDKNIFYLYGWNDQALQLVSYASTGWDKLVEEAYAFSAPPTP